MQTSLILANVGKHIVPNADRTFATKASGSVYRGHAGVFEQDAGGDVERKVAALGIGPVEPPGNVVDLRNLITTKWLNLNSLRGNRGEYKQW